MSLWRKLRWGKAPENATIHEATRVGDVDKVKALLQENPNLVFSTEETAGWTPLQAAAYRGFEDLAELLLAHGADVDEGGSTNNTPLHLAADSGNEKMAHLLLSHHAAFNIKNSDGETPLHIAELARHREKVAIVLRHAVWHGGRG